MFQFPGLASQADELRRDTCKQVDYSIRKFADQIMLADPRNLSQLTTSFIASKSLGILHAPLMFFSVKLTTFTFTLFNFNKMSKNFEAFEFRFYASLYRSHIINIVQKNELAMIFERNLKKTWEIFNLNKKTPDSERQ